MIILAVISIVGIIVVQVYWVSRAVLEEEESFDHNVRMSLRAVADNMCQIDGNELISNKPIDRVSSNYFIARLQYNIDIGVLEQLINQQFKERGIELDYEYGVYNCENDRMVFGNQVSFASQRSVSTVSVPKLAEDEYYFGVYFPSKTKGLLSKMSLWKFMTAGTLVMIVFFGYGLVVVLKQKRLSEIQKEFIDNVTHELKTPLATLKLSAEALQQQPTAEKSDRYARIILEETERLEQHVEKVLTTSILDKGGRLEKQLIDLDELISDLTEKFKVEYEGIHWELICNPVGTILTNRGAFETIIRNLVDNAAKYGNGHVGLVTRRKKQFIEVIVYDNGPGIPANYEKKIFKKFFRVPQDDVHAVKGHGLGMYLVEQNVKLIGGKIRLDQHAEHTSFIVQIPMK